jgi:hypothetical protein
MAFMCVALCPAVEEYVGKGDILNDCISHPDKYTERHVAVCLAKPLLQALAHLHENNIIHRCAPLSGLSQRQMETAERKSRVSRQAGACAVIRKPCYAAYGQEGRAGRRAGLAGRCICCNSGPCKAAYASKRSLLGF